MGYAGSSFYDTPYIDALARKGVRFTQAYADAAICSPTRAALMTGQHPARLHITNWIPGQQPPGKSLKEPAIPGELPLEHTTLAESLRNRGYHTFFAGKWHLGGDGYHPGDQGFEINVGGGHMGQPPGGYFSPYQNPLLKDGAAGEYLPDRLTSETINFIKQNRKAPFFAYLSFYTVHTPIEPAVEYFDTYVNKAEALGPGGQPDEQPERGGVTKLRQDNPAYASMIAAMDHNVGRLLDTLEAMRLDENTIIIFTSDNGGLATLDPSHAIYQNGIPTSNFPLRAGKGWLYEGGIRVPLIIHVPGVSNGADATPVTSTDLYATLLEMTGASSDLPVDGRSLVPVITGRSQLTQRNLYWHFPHYHGSGSVPSSAIRSGPWKLIYFYEDNGSELYNLDNDPGEAINLALNHPDIAGELLSDLRAWLSEVGADIPTRNDQAERAVTKSRNE